MPNSPETTLTNGLKTERIVWSRIFCHLVAWIRSQIWYWLTRLTSKECGWRSSTLRRPDRRSSTSAPPSRLWSTWCTWKAHSTTVWSKPLRSPQKFHFHSWLSFHFLHWCLQKYQNPLVPISWRCLIKVKMSACTFFYLPSPRQTEPWRTPSVSLPFKNSPTLSKGRMPSVILYRFLCQSSA